MKGQPKVSYDFGEYRLIPAERMLLKNGCPVQLGSKAFDILVVLVENAGELVDNKNMLEMVWPDSNVEEANIHVQISSLRKALEETTNGKGIETIPRIGYRFISEVRTINGSPLQPKPAGNHVGQSPETGADAAASIPVPSRNKSVAVVILVLAIVATGTALIGFRQFLKRPAPPFDRVTISKITNTGKELMSAISPDGTNLAYIHAENGKESIWLRNIPSGAEKKLLEPSESEIESLVFSPSGDSIYFSKSERNDRAAVFELSILDGTPKKVIDNVQGRVTFSPDASQVAFIRVDSVNSSWDVIIGNASGGGERTITRSPFEKLIRYPAWSPTSRKLAAFKHREDDDAGDRYSLVEIDADSGEINLISQERWQTFGDIAWLKDGTGMVFTASKQVGAPEQVWYLDRGTGTAKRLTNDTDNYSIVTLDSSSGVIAAVTTTLWSGIWTTEENEDVSHLANITTGAASQEGNWGVAFGASNKILYTADTDGKNNIWTMNPDGNERRRLTNGYYDHHPIVVPNTGNIIYVSLEPDGTRQIWTMAPDGSGKTKLTHQFRIYWHDVTPDSRWLVFSGRTDMAHSYIWKMPISGGDVIPISDKLVRSQMALSPDGKLLAFCTHEDTDKRKIMMLSPDTGEMVKELDTPPGFIPNTDFRWAPDGKAITYKAAFGPSWNLWNLPLDGGPPKQLTHFENEFILAFNWSTDGRLVLSKGKESSDVVLIRQQN